MFTPIPIIIFFCLFFFKIGGVVLIFITKKLSLKVIKNKANYKFSPFLIHLMVEKVLFLGEIFKMEILLHLCYEVPESENHILAFVLCVLST